MMAEESEGAEKPRCDAAIPQNFAASLQSLSTFPTVEYWPDRRATIQKRHIAKPNMKHRLVLALFPAAMASATLAQQPALEAPLKDKTLVVWAAPANLTQRGGSALTIDDGREIFDAVVFGEIAPAKWMAGSDFYRRTLRDQAVIPVETADAGTFVQMAIVYAGKQITVYRNGQLYSQHTMAEEHRSSAPPPGFTSENAIASRAIPRASPVPLMTPASTRRPCLRSKSRH